MDLRGQIHHDESPQRGPRAKDLLQWNALQFSEDALHVYGAGELPPALSMSDPLRIDDPSLLPHGKDFSLKEPTKGWKIKEKPACELKNPSLITMLRRGV